MPQAQVVVVVLVVQTAIHQAQAVQALLLVV
jgi:hypothetical protein